MDMQFLVQYLPFLIPVLVIELGLLVAALVHILRHKTYRIGNRPVWIVISVIFGIIGPVLYFIIGKGDE
jgi:tryptophan-rich sensory protein